MKKKISEEQPFYVDSAKLKGEEAQYRTALRYLNNALDLYKSTTGKEITSLDEFKEMVADPCKFYTEAILSENRERTEKLREILGDQLSLERFAESAMIFPQGFDQVETACARVREERFGLKQYTLADGRIQLSQEFYLRQFGKSIFYAITPLERKRLAFAEKLRDSFLKDHAELVRKEAEELGIPENKVSRVIESLDFIGPVPYPLRIEVVYDEKLRASKKLLINEAFVSHGHPLLFPKKEIRRQEPQKKFRVAHVRTMDGRVDQKLFDEGDPVPLDPLRQRKTKLLPHLYVLENGKLVQMERGMSYPEHPLIEQIEELLTKK